MTRIRAAGLVLLLGAMAAAIVFASVHARRHRFDMVAQLAQLAQREGTWDNQWDKIPQKLAELQGALAKEKDPGRRVALAVEVANHALYGGDNDLAISTLEAVLRDGGRTLPPPLRLLYRAVWKPRFAKTPRW